jgi:hypothetical protein
VRVNCFARGSASVVMAIALACLRPYGSLAVESDQDAIIEHSACTVLRMQPTGMLMGCGLRVLSLLLVMDDVSRQVRFTEDGAFHFICPIEQMCEGQPRIDGWIILKEAWQNSTQDEAAMKRVLQLPPAVRGPDTKPSEFSPESPNSVCGTFAITIAEMNGRGACYASDDNGSATVATIVSGPELGFAILFSQSTTNWQALQKRALDLAHSFKLERAEGDGKLLQWIR